MSDSEEVEDLGLEAGSEEDISVFRKREKVEVGSSEDVLIDIEAFRRLNGMLTCPICLEVFQDPVYVKGCSHRFCKDCIEKAIRSSKMKQCPTCRRVIGTKRQLRTDYNALSLITTIFGNVSVWLLKKQNSENLLLAKTVNSLSNHETEARKLLKQRQELVIETPDQLAAAALAAAASAKSAEQSQQIRAATRQLSSSNSSLQQDSSQSQLLHSRRPLLPHHLKRTGRRKRTRIAARTSRKQQNQQQINAKGIQQSSSEQDDDADDSEKEEVIVSRPNNRRRERDVSTKHSSNGVTGRQFRESSEEDNDKEEEGQQQQTTERRRVKKLKKEDPSQSQAQQPQQQLQLNPEHLIERQLISLSLNVLPFDLMKNQFDIFVPSLDWRLTLADIAKLICNKLSINSIKAIPALKLFIKPINAAVATHQPFQLIDNKTATLKALCEDHWNGGHPQRTEYFDTKESIAIARKGLNTLYYMIELKEAQLEFV